MTIEMGDDPKLRTIWCGNLASRVTDEILYELFLQAGPLDSISVPKDKNGSNRGYAFITFKHECSVPYAKNLFEGTALFDRELRLTARVNEASKIKSPAINAPIPACFLPLQYPILNDQKSNSSKEENRFLIESSSFCQTFIPNGNADNRFPFVPLSIPINPIISPLMQATLRGQWNSNFQQNENRRGEKDLRDRIRERERNHYERKREPYDRHRDRRRHTK